MKRSLIANNRGQNRFSIAPSFHPVSPFVASRIPTYDPPDPRILFSGVAHGPALRH